MIEGKKKASPLLLLRALWLPLFLFSIDAWHLFPPHHPRSTHCAPKRRGGCPPREGGGGQNTPHKIRTPNNKNSFLGKNSCLYPLLSHHHPLGLSPRMPFADENPLSPLTAQHAKKNLLSHPPKKGAGRRLPAAPDTLKFCLQQHKSGTDGRTRFETFIAAFFVDIAPVSLFPIPPSPPNSFYRGRRADRLPL